MSQGNGAPPVHLLPAKPTVAPPAARPLAARIVPSGLPAKPSFALPPKPSAIYSRDDRSPSPRRRVERDSYIPRSPTPERDWDRRDTYRPPSVRADWDRNDTYVPRSPSPRQNSVSPSPARSPSPDLPKTFFTFSHKKAEEKASRDEERRIRAEERRKQHEEKAAERAKVRAEKEAGWAAEREQRRTLLYGSEGESSRKRAALEQLGPARKIPTGPKAGVHIPGAPTGPRARTNGVIPTGPRAMARAFHTTTRAQQPALAEKDVEEIVGMTKRKRSKSMSSKRSHSPKSRSPSPTPSLRNRDQIIASNSELTLGEEYLARTELELKKWLAERSLQAKYTNEKRSKGIHKSTITIPLKSKVSGTGEGKNQGAAKVAADLDALYELQRRGLLETPQLPDSEAPDPEVEETIRLSNGVAIDYDAAHAFMTYYRNRYNFDEPEIELARSGDEWEAVMSVGGRRIGMGSGATKKVAQRKAYLDVTQYLDSCDESLWTDYRDSQKQPAPKLVFQMSDRLNEDIFGLCSDIKQSKLFQNAPKDGAVLEEPARRPSWSRTVDPALSQRLKARLEEYRTDPKLADMRAQRGALPIFTKTDEIMDAITENDVTVLMAATGSGKTTQVPQMLLDSFIDRGEGANCKILCTQPRRIAARSVAERVAIERGEPLGWEIGYHIRFDAKLPQPQGSITYMTTGILQRRLQSLSADMDAVTHIIVDEAHERDIDTDLLLAVLKRWSARRRAAGNPLKIVLMSATIDPTLFQQYFADERGLARVIDIPGRTYPVERHFLDDIVPELQKYPEASTALSNSKVNEYLVRELADDPALFAYEGNSPFPTSLIALTISHILKQSDDGHVLVFLPGWLEIKDVSDLLRRPLINGVNTGGPEYSIHYLHSAIPPDEQREVFTAPAEGVRRIILATNIAETSITIPNVVYVVDAGRLRENRYDPQKRMSSLDLAWVSKSNLDQRAGRAGRHRPGQYYSLLSHMRRESLRTHQLVEMKRENLNNVVMHVKALNIGAVQEVLGQCIEPPDPERITSAIEFLQQLGALDPSERLTSLGRVLQAFPIEAAVGKLLLYGSMFRCLDSALTIAAILSLGDPFIVPPSAREQARKIQNSFSPSAFRSDVLAGLMAFNKWRDIEAQSWEQACQFCAENMLRISSMLSIRTLREQLLKNLYSSGVIAVSAASDLAYRKKEIPDELNNHNDSLPLMAALIAIGSAPNFAIRSFKEILKGSSDAMLMISSSSVNHKKRDSSGAMSPSASYNPSEKRIYAYAQMSAADSAFTPSKKKKQQQQQMATLRTTTRLDPLTYMLFGAYKLERSGQGMKSDSWLPLVGNPYALSDVQQLKTLLETCMLRVFEGIGKSLVMRKDSRRSGYSSPRISDETNEDETEDEREVLPLDNDEVRELQLLTTDVVRILDAYAREREGEKIYASSQDYGSDDD